MADASYPEQWANRECVHNYLEIADIMVVGRRKSLDILKSFYRHFLMEQKPNTILDLGCGDGILTHELMQVDDSISAVLADGSPDMLEKARERLTDLKQCQFINASFQELMSEKIELPVCNFAVSSLAIHHLTSSEKKSFFKYIYSHLADGGYFLNIDVVRSAALAIEKWHMELWLEGVLEQQPPPGFEEIFEETVNTYKKDDHYSKVDPMESQMASLAEAGFKEVDCYYKQGMFAIYGGRKC